MKLKMHVDRYFEINRFQLKEVYVYLCFRVFKASCNLPPVGCLSTYFES